MTAAALFLKKLHLSSIPSNEQVVTPKTAFWLAVGAFNTQTHYHFYLCLLVSRVPLLPSAESYNALNMLR